MKATYFGLVSFFALSLAACGQDIQAVCEEAQEQDCTSVTNCEKAVELGTALAEASTCETEYDAYVECATGVDDVCTIDAGCASKTNAFAECVAPYCVDNADECNAFVEVSGL